MPQRGRGDVMQDPGGAVFCLALVIVASAVADCAAEPEAIFRDPFLGPALDAGWSVDASAANTVSLKPGFVEITAAENTYAHIERPLGMDNVRVSCAIRPGSGISWATSLFLYWRPGGGGPGDRTSRGRLRRPDPTVKGA
jgi:hypothetical protein